MSTAAAGDTSEADGASLRIDGSWVLGYGDGGHYLIAEGSVVVAQGTSV